MELGKQISFYRKELNMTQDALAQKLGVSNQAVSKWEADQCCPDIGLLPAMADLFGISMDTLFGRETAPRQKMEGLPWPDDNTLYVVLYVGHELVGNAKAANDISFTYEGPALNVHSAITVHCSDVGGDVDAGCDVSCGNVTGNVDAGCDVSCGNVDGSVDAGCDVRCGNICGDVDAGTSVTCGDVNGDVDAGCDVHCGNVAGDVDAGISIRCEKIG